MINQDEKNCIFSIINLWFQNDRKKINNSGICSMVFSHFDFEFLVFCSVVDTVFVPNKKNRMKSHERKRRKEINIVIQNTAEF